MAGSMNDEASFLKRGNVEIKITGIMTVFTYSLIIGDKQCQVEIAFEDGKFAFVSYPFSGKYTREQWKALALIEQTVAKLEQVWEAGIEAGKLMESYPNYGRCAFCGRKNNTGGNNGGINE